mmetsp:Transcript_17526/g.22776  ORF Transcript_17526/g.22776 Transcript_17526/m.22776 type:complete len:520 (-) Transcript_17526:872-2431(-)
MVLTASDMTATQISNFDGQTIWDKHGNKMYEIGNYLGGGVAGVVYEVEHVKDFQHFALKILNPVGYKLERKAVLKQCKVLVKGEMLNRFEDGSYEPLDARHVWWLIHTPSSAVIAAYHDVEKGDLLREMTLPKCVGVWGLAAVDSPSGRQVTCDGRLIDVPTLPQKYIDFLANRGKIFREILNMARLSVHVNVLRLFEVMELLQDSKCTLFLVLELAKGGELFDRIAIDQGASEDVAKKYLRQLLEGLEHCHEQGVCHRDLKPENLLLADDDGCLLKIADFGLSATFREEPLNGSLPLRRTLQSVVGSPFYVAPEVLSYQGYDGTKADMWSVGVILYAMLAGNLPFGKDLASCVRFAKFKQWIETQPTLAGAPTWLFPSKASEDAKTLLMALLNPNPAHRISVQEAMDHKWVDRQKPAEQAVSLSNQQPLSKETSNPPSPASPPSGLSKMLAADSGSSSHTSISSPSRRARAVDMYSSPPLSHEPRDGSPRLESPRLETLTSDATEYVNRTSFSLNILL